MHSDMQEAYINSLKNKLFGLLCEFEKGREWEKFLDSILIELQGIPENARGINFYHLIYKLNMLKYLRYEYFRSTIFDCMNLLNTSLKENNTNVVF